VERIWRRAVEARPSVLYGESRHSDRIYSFDAGCEIGDSSPASPSSSVGSRWHTIAPMILVLDGVEGSSVQVITREKGVVDGSEIMPA
jgi:hypothetical protein